MAQLLVGVGKRLLRSKFLFQPHPVEAISRAAPVYWANDLFLRRAISLAADMAKSGRTPAPRTCRHGHSRAPLSAARRTFDSFRQARLANLLDSAAPASPRAALHLAHSSERSRSDLDHAAARHARRSQGFCAASWRLDRRASRATCRKPRRFMRVLWCRCAAFHTGSCIAPVSAARCGPKPATAAKRSSASPAAPNTSSAGSTTTSSAKHARICRRRRRPMPGAWRQGQAAVDPRSVEPLGLLHLGGFAVVLVAADPGAALRARLSRRP